MSDQHLQAEAVERVRALRTWLAEKHLMAGRGELPADVRAIDALLANLDKLATERQAADAMADAFEALALDRLTALAAAEAERDALSVKLTALEGALAPVIATVNALDGVYGFTNSTRVSTEHFGLPYNEWPSFNWGDLRNVRDQALSDLPPSPGVESVLAAADANREGVEP